MLCCSMLCWWTPVLYWWILGCSLLAGALTMAASNSLTGSTISQFRCRPLGGCPVGPEDVDDEHERVRALDTRLRGSGLAVTVGRRDHEQDPAADLPADQTLVPARNDLRWRGSHGKGGRGLAAPRGVEGLMAGPDHAHVLCDDKVAPANGGASVADQGLHGECLRRRAVRDRHRRCRALRAPDDGQRTTAVGNLLTACGGCRGIRLDHVHHEDQGVRCLDTALRVALGTVTVGRRDHGEHAAAGALPDQRQLQALEQLRSWREQRRRRLLGERVHLERRLLAAPDVGLVIADEFVGMDEQ